MAYLARAPAGTLGVPGDFCLDVASGDVYEKTGTSSWTHRINIKGPPGMNGIDGTPGESGSPKPARLRPA
jgi:hypothetical protein